MKHFFIISLFLSVAFFGQVQAGEVGISKDIKSITVETPDGPVVIQRNPDVEAVIDPAFAKTSRPCPPFCIQPMKVAEGVETVAELEVIKMLKDKEALLVDARTQDWHFKSTIPSSLNIPYVEVTQRLDELGCMKSDGKWDCANAKKVILYCNGPWCGQSPLAIRAMLREGFPPEQIKYYRGGMQSWSSFGLNVLQDGF